MVDELHIHIAHILLGAGTRLFDAGLHAPTPLERTRALESPYVTHLRFAVRKEGLR